MHRSQLIVTLGFLFRKYPSMSQDQRNLEFRQIADKFIDLANNESEGKNSATIGSSMLYACARFSSFVVASHAKDKAHFE